MEKFP